MSHLVEDTAFVIAHYRAQDPTFSKDIFAKLWDTKKAAEIAKRFSAHVSPFESILHGARNRMILKALKNVIEDASQTLIINIGAGFSMYPFALPKEIEHLEIDLPHVSGYKEEHINAFVQNKQLPSRTVNFASYDITDTQHLTSLSQRIAEIEKKKKIIIMEGLFFFLSSNETEQLLNFCADTLSSGDIVICESYQKGIETSAVYKRLLAFFRSDFNLKSTEHTTYDPSYFQHFPNFDFLSSANSLDVAKKCGKIDMSIPETKVLNEYIYSLQRH